MYKVCKPIKTADKAVFIGPHSMAVGNKPQGRLIQQTLIWKSGILLDGGEDGGVFDFLILCEKEDLGQDLCGFGIFVYEG